MISSNLVTEVPKLLTTQADSFGSSNMEYNSDEERIGAFTLPGKPDEEAQRLPKNSLEWEHRKIQKRNTQLQASNNELRELLQQTLALVKEQENTIIAPLME